MIQWMKDHPAKARGVAVFVLAALLVGVFLAPVLAEGDAQLSAYRDGTRDASAMTDAISSAPDVTVKAVVASPLLLERVDAPEHTFLVILGVEKPLTGDETAAILNLVDAGATLLVADDTGNANTLLKDTGLAVIGRQLVDLENNYQVSPGSPGEPEFPVADADFAGERYPLLFNKPSFIKIFEGADAAVIARSGTASFDSTGREGEDIDIRAEPGPYTLLAEVGHGAGRILVVSDTGPFVNEVMALSSTSDDAGAPYRNHAFATALAAHYLPEGGTVLVDESRHIQPGPVRAANGFLRAYALLTLTPVLREVLLFTLVAAVAFTVWRTRHAEDWSVHVFDVGEKRPLPADVTPTPERVRAMALRAAAERFNVSTDYLQAMSREEVARLTGDPDLAQVIAGKEADSRIILQKLIGANEERPR